jgi:septum formation protein
VRLVLASTSPARLALLRAAGIDPVVVPSDVDEPAAIAAAGPLEAEAMVLLLARAKAEAVAAAIARGAVAVPDDAALVLGGDSAFALDGGVHGKPGTPEAAAARWRIQRGREGVLHSGHWLIDRRTGRGRGAVTSATVRFADDLDDEEIDAYVATGEPLAVAGAFTIDGLGGPFVERIEGDHHGVVGLSLPLLRELLGEVGVRIPDLWRKS